MLYFSEIWNGIVILDRLAQISLWWQLLLDLLNLLTGVLIFLILVVKSAVWDKLQERLRTISNSATQQTTLAMR